MQFDAGIARTLLLLDLVMFLLAAYFAGAVVARHWSLHYFAQRFYQSSVIFVAIWLICFERLGLYRWSFALSFKDEFYYTAVALGLGVVPQFILFSIVPALSTSRLVLVYSFLIAIVLVGGSRMVAHAIRNELLRRQERKPAILGDEEAIRAVQESLSSSESLAKASELWQPNASWTVDDYSRWFGVLASQGCKDLWLTKPLARHELALMLETAADHGVNVAFAIPGLRCSGYPLRIEHSGHQTLLLPSRLKSCGARFRLTKRIADVLLAVPILLLSSPFMLLAALAIWFSSGQPIFFRQKRVGRGGKTFEVFKFRTMRTNDDRSWATPGDSRITPVGKFLRRFSIDELPQLFNVVRGEMSLVGPRPEMVEFVAEFEQRFPRYSERHFVKPGITGWAQINMRRILQPSDIEQVLAHDLFYVENASIYLDCSILAKTIAEFVFHRVA